MTSFLSKQVVLGKILTSVEISVTAQEWDNMWSVNVTVMNMTIINCKIDHTVLFCGLPRGCFPRAFRTKILMYGYIPLQWSQISHIYPESQENKGQDIVVTDQQKASLWLCTTEKAARETRLLTPCTNHSQHISIPTEDLCSELLNPNSAANNMMLSVRFNKASVQHNIINPIDRHFR